MRKNETDTLESVLSPPATTPCLTAHEPMTLAFGNARSRPFWAQDRSPLAWWRTLPSGAFGASERLLLQATLEQIGVLHGGDQFVAALAGDPSGAIDVAFSLMPIGEMSLTSDIAMTALLRCSLERNATAALVLAQVLGLTALDHCAELATSWLAYGRLFSDDKQKFGDAEIVLLSAFRDRQRDGDDVEDPDSF